MIMIRDFISLLSNNLSGQSKNFIPYLDYKYVIYISDVTRRFLVTVFKDYSAGPLA